MSNETDIAIVGMSGLFPDAPDIDSFWSNISNKVDSISDPPPGWLPNPVFHDPDTANVTRIYTQRGGFLGDLSRFDPRPFGTMPVSVVGGEPDQFLALKAATDAIADAGYANRDFNRDRTGIILGHAVHAHRANVNGIQRGLVIDQTMQLLQSIFPHLTEPAGDQIRELLQSKLPQINVDAAPGLVPNMMTGRIANRLDLMGPNYILDAACASSLVAIDGAIKELNSNNADMMLAGGVNSTTSMLVFMVFCQLGALSRNPNIRPFSKDADGTLLGEGLGLVVLKRLTDALKDGDRIYAVIKGVGLSSDGRGTGLMAPRMEGEIAAIKRAYEYTKVDPATVGLIETHGTGIPLGDKTEIQALHSVFGDRRGFCPDVAIGSVKSMIGHCIPAAGIASTIKMAMSLHSCTLAPTLCDDVSPELGLDETPFYVNTDTNPWIHAGRAPRRAAINAFGFGGVNSHMILEEAPRASSSVPTGAAFYARTSRNSELFLFGGKERTELLAAINEVSARLEDAGGLPLAQLATEAASRVRPGDWRLAFSAGSVAELRKQLDAATAKLSDESTRRIKTRSGLFFCKEPVKGKVAFLFPGENSQYPGMLREIALVSPLVREQLDALESLFHDKRDIQHRVMLYPPNGLKEEQRQTISDRLMDVDAGSEAVFFADQALFALTQKIGIKPDLLLGHSTGENAALVASGLLNLSPKQVGQFIVKMNQIYRRIADSDELPQGSLLTVGAIDRERLSSVLADYDDVQCTMDNCPNQAVLFGDPDRIEQLANDLKAHGAICGLLPLTSAYHTEHMSPMAEAFHELFAGVKLKKPIGEVYSCVAAVPFPSDGEGARQLAVRQYSEQVRFTDSVRKLFEDGARIFLEVGPSGYLTGFVRDILADKPHIAVATNQRQKDAHVQILRAIAELFVNQVQIDVRALYPGIDSIAESDARPQPKGPAPALPSELPTISLSEDDVDQIRGLLEASQHSPDEATASPPRRKLQCASRTESASADVVAVPEPVGDGQRAAAMVEHMKLMTNFLASQERVGRQLMNSGQRPSLSVNVARWSEYFPLPFRTEIIHATWTGAAAGRIPEEFLQSLAQQRLSRDEMEIWEHNRIKWHHNRQAEWLLGRFAAKSAVQAWCRRAWNADLDVRQIEVLIGDSGQPVVRIADRGADTQDTPSVSISHALGHVVATSSHRPAGVDMDFPERLNDPAGLIESICCEQELGLIERSRSVNQAVSATSVWAIKEAAAKAMLTPLLGRERQFRIDRFSDSEGFASVSYEGREIHAYLRRASNMLCAVAYAN